MNLLDFPVEILVHILAYSDPHSFCAGIRVCKDLYDCGVSLKTIKMKQYARMYCDSLLEFAIKHNNLMLVKEALLSEDLNISPSVLNSCSPEILTLLKSKMIPRTVKAKKGVPNKKRKVNTISDIMLEKFLVDGNIDAHIATRDLSAFPYSSRFIKAMCETKNLLWIQKYVDSIPNPLEYWESVSSTNDIDLIFSHTLPITNYLLGKGFNTCPSGRAIIELFKQNEDPNELMKVIESMKWRFFTEQSVENKRYFNRDQKHATPSFVDFKRLLFKYVEESDKYSLLTLFMEHKLIYSKDTHLAFGEYPKVFLFLYLNGFSVHEVTIDHIIEWDDLERFKLLLAYNVNIAMVIEKVMHHHGGNKIKPIGKIICYCLDNKWPLLFTRYQKFDPELADTLVFVLKYYPGLEFHEQYLSLLPLETLEILAGYGRKFTIDLDTTKCTELVILQYKYQQLVELNRISSREWDCEKIERRMIALHQRGIRYIGEKFKSCLRQLGRIELINKLFN